MRTLIILITICAMQACDTQLSEERRKALREEMEQREPKRIGEEEVYQAVLTAGQDVIGELMNEVPLDQVASDCKCTIMFTSDAEGLDGKELELFNLYSQTPDAPENVQKDGDNHLLYTIAEHYPDSLTRVWIVRFERRRIVLSL